MSSEIFWLGVLSSDYQTEVIFKLEPFQSVHIIFCVTIFIPNKKMKNKRT